MNIREQYDQLGVVDFYRQHGASYRNPHEEAVRRAVKLAVSRWNLPTKPVLDLACGSGEVTLAIREVGGDTDGVDPYTGSAYLKRTGQEAISGSFEDIAAGSLALKKYSLIICSYALHLIEPSKLPLLLFKLGRISPLLVIVSPHKNPVIKPEWGWKISSEFTEERVHARLFASRE